MPDRRYTRWMRIRLLSVVAVLAVLSGFVIWRIWTLQVSQSEWLGKLARNQYLKEVTLEPMRGAIADRNGAPMAVSVMTDSVFVMPRELVDSKAATRDLATALGLDPIRLGERLSKRKQFTWVKRRITPAESKRVRALEHKGIHLTAESRRFYPVRELAASLIGFAGDGKGLEGLELLYDGRLRGSTVLAQGLRDAHGNMLFADGVGHAEHGDSTRIDLTIDLTIQEIVEAELERAVRETGARRGIAVVMDPHTGEVLAMATAPSFNPNEYSKYAQSRFRNRAVGDCFEPGSTLKIFTLATALQAGSIGLADQFDCGPGKLKVGPHTIHDSGHLVAGQVPLPDVLIHSKNTCTAMIGLELGRERLYAGLRSFGFGRKTDIDLPGESRCLLRPAKAWYDVDLATISFGQGVSVSAIQLTAALSAVANGGVYMRPLIVRSIRGGNAEALQRFEPEPLGRVVDERWAREIGRMMVGVTEPGGTGTRGAIPGYSVAGKTGTAQKPDPIAGGYSKDKRVASFMGFVPAESPRIAALVVLDEPQTSRYGGVVAAPVFSSIGEKVLSYLGVYPVQAAKPQDLENETPVEMAGAELTEDWNLDGPVETPAAPALEAGAMRLPDVRGLSSRAALRKLAAFGLDVAVEGSGRVARQQPRPGSPVRTPGRVVLELERIRSAGTELAGSSGELASR